MRFLISQGGHVEKQFAGILTSPGHRGIPRGIKEGRAWAADNQCYTQHFDELVYYEWLESVWNVSQNCLFVALPDVVGDGEATRELFKYYEPDFAGLPMAYVAQDGSESLSLPPRFDCLFIGGTTEWKMSDAATWMIKKAVSLGKHIHIGRVNYQKRYMHFRKIIGSDNFTCDGNRPAFDGKEKTYKAWTRYQETGVMQII